MSLCVTYRFDLRAERSCVHLMLSGTCKLLFLLIPSVPVQGGREVLRLSSCKLLAGFRATE